ncbi:hypothetical protein [Magnetococcus marinus]|uniref:hypothetical protein n=1 Tax=Magnetococcus marinus TaxID=1124597 RepID=UPI0000381BD6|nr:hypothetical protein [Magnetococcus marinus]
MGQYPLIRNLHHMVDRILLHKFRLPRGYLKRAVRDNMLALLLSLGMVTSLMGSMVVGSGYMPAPGSYTLISYAQHAGY